MNPELHNPPAVRPGQNPLEELRKNPVIQYTEQCPEAIRAEMCRRDFYFFIQEFWQEIISDDPVWNWHIRYLCKELQKMCFRVMAKKAKEYDLIVNIPPGTTKSTIFVQMFPAWAWICALPRAKEFQKVYERFDAQQNRRDESNRETRIMGSYLRFICGSYSSPLALEHADYTRDIVRSARYKLYFPEVEIRRDKEVKSNYKLNKGGTRFSTSVGASVTGVHAHIILIDDPIDPEGSCSAVDRTKANRWIDKTLSTRKVNKEITPTILIMQRLHEDDPSGHKLKKRNDLKIKHICLPGSIPAESSKIQINPPELKKYYKKGLLDPKRLGAAVLQEMKINLGSYGYAGQLMQSPVPGEGGTFQRQWFKMISEAPQDGTRIRYWDFAGTEPTGSGDPDYTVGGLGIWKEGQLYLTQFIRKRISAKAVEDLVKQTAQMDGKGVTVWIEQEPGSSGKHIISHFQRNVLPGFAVKGEPKSKSKIEYARPYSAAAEAGNIFIVEGHWNEAFLDEHEVFPNGSHDDTIDVGCGLHRKLTKEMNAGVIWV